MSNNITYKGSVGPLGDRLEEVRYRISSRDHLIRRGIHLISGAVVVYYLFPSTFLFLPMKLWLIVLLGFVPLVMEVIRLKRGMLIFGQREFERGRIASYAWALWTSMVIMLVLPQEIALPVILIYTLADPVIGEVRLWKKYLVLPVAGTFVFFLFLVFGYHPFLALFAAFFMVSGEALEIAGHIQVRPELYRIYRNSKFRENLVLAFRTDDNATTQLVPALALGLVYLFFPGWFPDPWFYPLL
ncbi:MAG: hypothetical protein JW939_07015 [Candidatus Thermoplasmatota archaeon]|nr:hypothetical protein [Candidatus Thermoplasmatota archaeon]